MSEQATTALASEAAADRPTTLRWLGIAVLLGIGLGALSVVGDFTTDDGPAILLNALANAMGPWVVVAFVAGVAAGRPVAGIVAGVVALAVAVVAYYLGAVIFWGDRVPDLRVTILVWLAAGLAAGSVLGGPGGTRAGADRRWRPLAAALLSGGLLAEAAYYANDLAKCNCLDATRPALYVVLINFAMAIIAPIILVAPGSRLRTYAYAAGLAVGGYAAIVLVFAAVRASFFVVSG
jgi:Family of unknown function (DUF6518)